MLRHWSLFPDQKSSEKKALKKCDRKWQETHRTARARESSYSSKTERPTTINHDQERSSPPKTPRPQSRKDNLSRDEKPPSHAIHLLHEPSSHYAREILQRFTTSNGRSLFNLKEEGEM
ncbi:hypothetical protein N7G274_000884 [Stereocaulon virgatum]|uniref:Uncharacterized protein n=1 Tax=Stereocaulon virgatum TaxID=373712 RepID=A0ABR4APW1_9LECA